MPAMITNAASRWVMAASCCNQSRRRFDSENGKSVLRKCALAITHASARKKNAQNAERRGRSRSSSRRMMSLSGFWDITDEYQIAWSFTFEGIVSLCKSLDCSLYGNGLALRRVGHHIDFLPRVQRRVRQKITHISKSSDRRPQVPCRVRLDLRLGVDDIDHCARRKLVGG